MPKLLVAALAVLGLAACDDTENPAESEQFATETSPPEAPKAAPADAAAPVADAGTSAAPAPDAAPNAAAQGATTDDPIETDPGAAGDPGSAVR